MSYALPITKLRVGSVKLGGELWLLASGSPELGVSAQRETKIALSSVFSFTSKDGTQHQLDGSGDWSELVPIFDLRHAVITSATVDQDRTLTLRFSTGARLVAPRNPTGYEAWNVAGPDGRFDVA